VFFVGGSRKRLDKLAVIYAHSKAGVDSVKVGLEAIGRDLEVSRRGPFQFFGESHCVSGAAPSQVPSQDKFCVAFDSDKTVGIPACRIARDVALFLASHVTPNFVQFNISYGYIVDSAFQEPFAFLANENKQGKYCCVVKASEALDRADGASLNKKLYRLSSLIQWGIHAAKRCGVIFCKGLATLLTAETLKAVAMLSKFLASGIAVVTGHYEPCLSLAIGSQWSLKGSSEQSLGFGPAGCYQHPAGLLVNTSLLLVRQPAKSSRVIPADVNDTSVTSKSSHTSCTQPRESPDAFPQIRILSIYIDSFQMFFLPCNNSVNADEQIFGRTSGNAPLKQNISDLCCGQWLSCLLENRSDLFGKSDRLKARGYRLISHKFDRFQEFIETYKFALNCFTLFIEGCLFGSNLLLSLYQYLFAAYRVLFGFFVVHIRTFRQRQG
jgi:hypothetical protein